MSKTIYTKDPKEYILKLAEALKGIEEFKIPQWANFVKSGASKERPPTDKDFWYIRSASILRQLYLKGVVGVGRLRTKYGSKKDRGGKPDKFKKAGGKIIRIILQQAEEAGLVEKMNKLQHGRRLTKKGREFLDSINLDSKEGIDFDKMVVSFKEEKEIKENQENGQ